MATCNNCSYGECSHDGSSYCECWPGWSGKSCDTYWDYNNPGNQTWIYLRVSLYSVFILACLWRLKLLITPLITQRRYRVGSGSGACGGLRHLYLYNDSSFIQITSLLFVIPSCSSAIAVCLFAPRIEPVLAATLSSSLYLLCAAEAAFFCLRRLLMAHSRTHPPTRRMLYYGDRSNLAFLFLCLVIHIVVICLDDLRLRRQLLSITNGAYGVMVFLDWIGAFVSYRQLSELLINTRTDSKSWVTLSSTTRLIGALVIELGFMIVVIGVTTFVRSGTSMDLKIVAYIIAIRDGSLMIGVPQVIMLMGRLPSKQTANPGPTTLVIATAGPSPRNAAMLSPSSPMGSSSKPLTAWSTASSPTVKGGGGRSSGGRFSQKDFINSNGRNSIPGYIHTPNNNNANNTNNNDSIAAVTPHNSPPAMSPLHPPRATATFADYH